MSATPDFLNLMRCYERADQNRPRIGASGTRSEDIVALGQEPHIEFSRQNVSAVQQTRDGKPFVVSRFLGLLGPQGALPLHTAYETTHWHNMRDPSFARFLNLFNQRFIQLFYRAWANARPAVQADRPRDNQFKCYIGSAIGIGTPPTQRRDSMPDFSKLAVAGLLAPAVKSASRLENLIAWMFHVRVGVEQFTGVWLSLDEQEQTALQRGKCELGLDTLLGRSAFSLTDKIRIKIAVSDLVEFEDFLPSGKYFKLLADAVTFYMGRILIYDVAMGLPESKTRPLQLGKFGRLGWTSWLGQKTNVNKSLLRWDCKFYPAELAK